MQELFKLDPFIVVPGLTVVPRLADSEKLNAAVEEVLTAAPLRHQTIPGGRVMAVAQSNCGELGWTADAKGYRYTPYDPLTGRPWPKIPAALGEAALAGATAAGFPDFEPDACLINVYTAGTQLGLHRDADEADLDHPIVSISLGAPATFVIGGLERRNAVRSFTLHDGDVMLLAGEARLRFHGVRPLKTAAPGAVHSSRVNLTFRKAG